VRAKPNGRATRPLPRLKRQRRKKEVDSTVCELSDLLVGYSFTDLYLQPRHVGVHFGDNLGEQIRTYRWADAEPENTDLAARSRDKRCALEIVDLSDDPPGALLDVTTDGG